MNKLVFILIISLAMIPSMLNGQNIELPSTPQNKWGFICTSAQDSINQSPVPVNFKLVNISDSTVICTGDSSYDSWTADDGFHEVERIIFVLPDFDVKYRLEISNKSYCDKSLVLDFSKTISLETPMEDRELKIEPVFLTKKQ